MVRNPKILTPLCYLQIIFLQTKCFIHFGIKTISKGYEFGYDTNNVIEKHIKGN